MAIKGNRSVHQNAIRVDGDGRQWTAIRGKHAMRRMVEFGENVLWLPETWEVGRMEKLEPKFEKEIWLGVCPWTDEAIIGTPAGVVRAGAVKRGNSNAAQGGDSEAPEF